MVEEMNDGGYREYQSRTAQKLKRLSWAFLTVVFVCPAFAQVDQEKIELWVKDYKNLPVTVAIKAANTIVVTEDAIRTKTELRLRQAGIQPLKSDADADYRLLVNVWFYDSAFHVYLAFGRQAAVTLPNGDRYTRKHDTWNVATLGTLGTDGSNGAYILSTLDQMLDKFLNAYLKANQIEESRVKPLLPSGSPAYVQFKSGPQEWVICGELKEIHLFAKPDWNSTIVETLACSQKVTVLETLGSWVHVRTQTNREGYVGSAFVAPVH